MQRPKRSPGGLSAVRALKPTDEAARPMNGCVGCCRQSLTSRKSNTKGAQPRQKLTPFLRVPTRTFKSTSALPDRPNSRDSSLAKAEPTVSRHLASTEKKARMTAMLFSEWLLDHVVQRVDQVANGSRFHPVSNTSGLVIVDGQVIDVKGNGMFVHAIQGMRPDSVGWCHLRC
jgi:hypothetical protein